MLTPHPYTPKNPAQAYLCNFSFSRALFIHLSIYLSIRRDGIFHASQLSQFSQFSQFSHKQPFPRVVVPRLIHRAGRGEGGMEIR